MTNVHSFPNQVRIEQRFLGALGGSRCFQVLQVVPGVSRCSRWFQVFLGGCFCHSHFPAQFYIGEVRLFNERKQILLHHLSTSSSHHPSTNLPFNSFLPPNIVIYACRSISATFSNFLVLTNKSTFTYCEVQKRHPFITFTPFQNSFAPCANCSDRVASEWSSVMFTLIQSVQIHLKMVVQCSSHCDYLADTMSCNVNVSQIKQ